MAVEAGLRTEVGQKAWLHQARGTAITAWLLTQSNLHHQRSRALNRVIRKAIKNRGELLHNQAAMRVMFLEFKAVVKKLVYTSPEPGTLNRFMIELHEHMLETLHINRTQASLCHTVQGLCRDGGSATNQPPRFPCFH